MDSFIMIFVLEGKHEREEGLREHVKNMREKKE
jgi:hypothetical protein